jgi:hypothetical protein
MVQIGSSYTVHNEIARFGIVETSEKRWNYGENKTKLVNSEV